ncbi:J domain-containing protein [Megalodesulfovibrio gigas]|uniref:Putative dnaJ domain protein n=1 Tax=Megalodesulfovibrio gigas (strain ATCC 19364 / DSM 1382 / NCIMB 9332 / VKM B-1759) TaxID=1121448 RepID=T2GCB5_MEGG1|nr:J domain-containing protein [Megalodesulfovibrio gigas]AGW13943.1 putative dnaJ domain protein [Megalodesulfovibrio gigas DSM 1382 = ATCC 19364]
MQRAEGYRLLRLPDGASLEEVKAAYRKLAFALHPDLNPGNPHAARQFQRLNEAYVLLKQYLEQDEAAAKRKAPPWEKPSTPPPGARSAEHGRPWEEPRQRTTPPSKEEVLQDILKDPFARQVFEDIYREARQGSRAGPSTAAPPPPKAPKPSATTSARPGASAAKAGPAAASARVKKAPRTMRVEWGDKKLDLDLSGGLWNAAKHWVRGWLDDEQTMHLPAVHLRPGTKVRLTVQQGVTETARAVEVVLPSDFVLGRPIRLKGLGRKFGPLKGDLYLRILAK